MNMNNTSPTFAANTMSPTANPNNPTPPSFFSPPQQHHADIESVRQAQREWRLNKRRELENKARKKQFRRTALSTSPPPPSQNHLSHQHLSQQHLPQPPHVHTPMLYTQMSPPQTTMHLPHAAVFAPHSAEMQHLSLQAVSNASLHHPVTITHPHPQLVSQFKTRAVDPNSSGLVVTAAAFHHHLNTTGKLERSAMEDATHAAVEDACEAAAAATAAAVHAAASASPGDAQFASSVAMTTPHLSLTPPLVSEEEPQHVRDVHKAAMDQYEAQRRWRENKRRQLAEKKAKGAGSKRGRKKARLTVAPAISAATAQLQESVSVAIASTPSIRTESPPIHIAMSNAFATRGSVGGHTHVLEEDPAAMYVRNAPTGEVVREIEENVQQDQPVDMEMPTTDEAEIAVQKEAGDSNHILIVSSLQTATAMQQTKFMSPIAHPDFSENPHQPMPIVSVEAQSKESVEKEGHCQMISVDESKVGEKDAAQMGELHMEKTPCEAAAEDGENADGEELENDAGDDNAHDGSENGNEPNANQADPTNVEAAAEGMTEGAHESVEGDVEEEVRDEARKNDDDGRGLEGLDGADGNSDQRAQDGVGIDDTDAKGDDFANVNGEDIMTAAAWQSLDSISHT